jgi:hypothetical protein
MDSSRKRKKGQGGVADLRIKFIKILRAELEDLIEDLGVAERKHAARFAHHEVTDYVFRQNEGLFRMEGDALRHILRDLAEFDPTRHEDLNQVVAAVDTLVRDLVKDHEEPGAMVGFVDRKLRKVRRYVESCDETLS